MGLVEIVKGWFSNKKSKGRTCKCIKGANNKWYPYQWTGSAYERMPGIGPFDQKEQCTSVTGCQCEENA